MTIKQQGGIFGRNPTFNDVTVDGTLSTGGTISTTSNMVIEAGSPNIRFMETDTTDQNYRIRLQAGGFIFEKLADNNSIVTECFRVDGSNNLALKTGSLVVANGQGIDFSATSGTGTSELFSDYEEGTWTPVPADAASGGNTGTAATAVGHYTKVGRVVTVAVDLVNIDKTGLTAGNAFFLQGLPFTAASLTGSIQFTGISSGGSTFGGTVIGPVVYDTNAAIRFFDPTGTITDSYLVSDVTANADVRFSLTYFA